MSIRPKIDLEIQCNPNRLFWYKLTSWFKFIWKGKGPRIAKQFWKRRVKMEDSKTVEDGGGIGRGDHFLFYKFIARTTERWTKFTKQLLIASGGHQAPRKAAHCLQREVGQGYWRLKGETRERGTETGPGKGVLLEEVSNHQETLALAGPGEVFKSQRAT